MSRPHHITQADVFQQELVAVRESGNSPTLTICAVKQVGSFLGYTGRAADVVARTAFDPKRPLVGASGCKRQRHNLFHARETLHDPFASLSALILAARNDRAPLRRFFSGRLPKSAGVLWRRNCIGIGKTRFRLLPVHDLGRAAPIAVVAVAAQPPIETWEKFETLTP